MGLESLGYLGLFLIFFFQALSIPTPAQATFIASLLISYKAENFDFLLLGVIVIVAYNLGSVFAYFIGKKGGRKMLEKKDSDLRKMTLLKADNFFEKYGLKSLIFGKFIGYGRIFLPTISGIFKINFIEFLLFNFIGITLWVFLISLIIFILGVDGTIILTGVVLTISLIICSYIFYYIYLKTNFIKDYHKTGKLNFKLLVSELEESDDKIISKLKLDKKIGNKIEYKENKENEKIKEELIEEIVNDINEDNEIDNNIDNKINNKSD